MLTMYDALACLDVQQRKKLIITEIKNKKDERLSRSLGNVNMTDFWLTLVEEFAEHDWNYSAQHIALLRDGEENWWGTFNLVEEVWVGLGFLKINYCGKNDIYEAKKAIKRNYEEAAVYYTFGNADFVVALRAKDKNELASRMKKIKELVECYSYYYVIAKVENQKSKNGRYVLEEAETFVAEECKRHTLYTEGVFYKLIQELQDKMLFYKNKVNKKMISYYHALLQIINVIIQYEQPKIYKDYIHMFYPPIRLFLEQLEAALEKRNSLEESIEFARSEKEKHELLIKLNKQRQKIENSFSEFLDDMEILLHHIGNSCRDVLMDNGRGGLPYDIPIKNCKMYLMYLSGMTYILNDKQDYEYQYCLAPLAYSRPTTGIFDFGLSPQKRLIEVRISRSMMYMPRALMVILAHEVSHYVGTEIRAREKRNKVYLQVVAQTLTYYIFNNLEEVYTISRQKLLIYFKKKVYRNICKSLIRNYNKIVEEQQNNDGSVFPEQLSHFYVYKENIRKAIFKVIEDAEGELHLTVYSVDESLKKEVLKASAGSKIDIIQQISRIQQEIMREIQFLLYREELWNFLEEFGKNMKEMFADLCAVKILNLSLDDLIEALLISEGKRLNMNQITPALKNRIALVDIVMQEKEEEKWQDGVELQSEELTSLVNEQIKLQIKQYEKCMNPMMRDTSENVEQNQDNNQEKDFFYCQDIVAVEKKYLIECWDKLQKRLDGGSEVKNLVDLIRKVFYHFGVFRREEEPSYEEFFGDFRSLEDWYAGIVKKLINKRRG